MISLSQILAHKNPQVCRGNYCGLFSQSAQRTQRKQILFFPPAAEKNLCSVASVRNIFILFISGWVAGFSPRWSSLLLKARSQSALSAGAHQKALDFQDNCCEKLISAKIFQYDKYSSYCRPADKFDKIGKLHK